DDGIATGSTARAACQVARAQGAIWVVLAAPVAPPSARSVLAGDADELVCLETPERFLAIGEWYDDFSQTRDEEVVSLLRAARAEHTESGQEEQVTGNADVVGGEGEGAVDDGAPAASVPGGRDAGAADSGVMAADPGGADPGGADVSGAEASATAVGGAGAAGGEAAGEGAGGEGAVGEEGAVGKERAGGAEGAGGEGAAGDSLASLVAMMPFAAGLGVVLDAAEPDEVRARLAWAPELCTTGDLLHGGALMS